ncbi:MULTISPECIES: CPBP family intramembrane glutamic endopeptidase [unclassified Pseudoclavibacter]|uniref:CPBP family intramembrane glutamic endopeptidase n=1 Tax=unclassified Pseudoclavibacter TaxID=2615177 RepID=UPI001BAAE1B3|nr:CPBP family intramembrane glutamic endopeptidase [Pseudoclavibacter sp. Marseille-Q4354]MBS3180196.1 CPBP family intramembrane metalloprotease [Pseudoclavibacter sp. Marseille-Q4354]
MSGRTDDLAQTAPKPSWKAFWERGGWWKAVVLVVAYYVLYQLGGLLFLPFEGGLEPSSAGAIIVGFALPIALGGLLLVAFALSLGWLRELFAPQPIRGKGWMWIAVAVVLVFNVLRFAALDYDSAGLDLVAAWLVAGLCIGFAEEVLTRGYVVNLMRKAGHSEIATATVSAALFAAMHSANVLTGQSVFATAIQVLYTFAFGICMYLALRVTGNLIWPVLLHATTDPSVFLLTAHPGTGPLTTFAGFGNIAVILFGLVAIIFIRGRVTPASQPSNEHEAERSR